jgi:outer membrane protein
MSERSLEAKAPRIAGVVVAVGLLLAGHRASALQPLSEFLAAARVSNHENLEASQITVQRESETDVAWTRVGPIATGRGAYTRNQYAVEPLLPPIAPGLSPRVVTLTPKEQLDGTLSLDWPVVDVAAWRRVGAARTTEQAARARGQSTELDVERGVARAFYQLVASYALMDASERSLAASRESFTNVRHRLDAGLVADLDAKRAEAEVERNLQTVADAEFGLEVARRALRTVSGLTPTDGGAELEEDLREEAPLAAWEQGIALVPAVRAAELESRAAEKTASAASATLLPTVNATGTERFTNAAGFGHGTVWAVGAAITWRIDPGAVPALRAQEAASAAARVRADRARIAAEDELHRAYHEVRADLAKSRSARAQIEATKLATKLARDRSAAGKATQLDIVQADRDAFEADVARIRADADLAYARLALRIAAGRSIAGKGEVR